VIVREIKAKPLALIGAFDFFNDYKDTRSWAVHNCTPDVVALLDAGHAVWLREHNERMSPKSL
jgi:hypothetical protein